MKTKETYFKIIVIYILLLSVSGCNNERSKSGSENILKKDIVVSYYSDGSIEILESYSHGKLDGNVVLFFQNGGLKQILRYHKGIINGPFYKYFKNGKLWIKKDLLMDSISIGATWEYFENGQIKKYRYYSHTGNLNYIREWNEKGFLTKEKGGVLGDFIAMDTLINNQEKILLETNLINPPNAETSLTIYESNIDGSNRSLLLKTTKKDTMLFINNVSPKIIEIRALLLDITTKKTHETIVKLKILHNWRKSSVSGPCGGRTCALPLI